MHNATTLLLITISCVLQSNFVPQASAAESSASPPNIVFLFADDQCTYSVGCYGNKDVRTPNMDRLARDGVVFDKHYNTTAICMASRANVFTGMYEYKTGCNFSHGDMRADVWAKSYPVLLRKAGYLTAFAGKFGIVVKGKGLCREDFDFWGGGPGQTNYATARNQSMKKYAKKYPHSTLSYAAFGKDVIRECVKRKKPFCLSISFKAPHKPATPDPRFNDVYAGKKFTKPKNFGRKFGEHLSPQSKSGRQYPRFTQWKYDTEYDGEMARYHQQVYGIDVAVGMIRNELKAQGIADNTVLIYTSDNGYICGSHGYGSKVLPMEESSRVPLMIYDPRSPLNGKQIRCNRLTGNIDFAPTILELAGLPIPSNMDGKSLLGLLNEPDKGGHDQMAFINTYGPLPTQSLSCLTKQYKYTYWWYGDKNMKPVEELFDTKNDPLELKNLANSLEYKAILDGMRKRYDRELAKWKRHGVNYNNYQRYGTLFDRTIPIAEKKIEKPNRRRKRRKSPALKLGFVPFDMSKVGLVERNERAENKSENDRPRATALAKRGNLIVDDNGSKNRGGKALTAFNDGVGLKTALGTWNRASPESNIWRSTWKKGMGHPPVAAYRGLDAKNLIVEVTFRYGEATEPWHNQFLRIAADRRPQLKGHIVSAWANSNSGYTKTGFVLEHVGKRNKTTGSRGLLLDHQPINTKPKTWYTATLEIVDDEALFRMGDHVAYAKAEQIRMPKNLVSLTLGTTWHEIKRVRIWHATANSQWKTNKAAILKSRKAFTPRPR